MVGLKKTINKIFKDKESYHEPDTALISVIFVILIFGMISLSSASSVVAYDKFGDAYYYFKHQLFGLTLGLIAFWFFSKVDYHIWKKYAFGFLVFSIILLLLVFIPVSSAIIANIESPLTSGRYINFCLLAPNPLPQKPPEPTAISD